MLRALLPALAVLSAIATVPVAAAPADELPLDRIRLPAGFRIELVARVPNARAMAWGERGTLFVGSMREGKVYALKPGSGEPIVIAQGLDMPVGVAFRQGDLYVSAVSRIVRLPGIEGRLDAPPKPEVVRGDLPSETHHGWRFIAFGPDGKLYVPIGAPCNICDRDADGYANILRMNADGSGQEVFARGVRNTVGFDWQPGSGKLWFTDNGRDMLGDDIPPDELNRADRAGQHFGYPYCHAGDIADPEFGAKRACSEFVPPARKLGAHVAALGIRFYTGRQFPAAYRGQAFVAEHGSWNRSKKSGYRVMRAIIKGDRVTDYQVFAEGWLQDEKPWGRPVDVLVDPDGALLVSDDHAGAVYRIRYTGN